jgi:putative DNA primase/helicase
LFFVDPFLLGCANGTLDLRTGALRTANPDDLISLGNDVPYDPDAKCPRWEQALEEIFAGDESLVSYIQRKVGYALTGDTREQVVDVLQGSGVTARTRSSSRSCGSSASRR